MCVLCKEDCFMHSKNTIFTMIKVSVKKCFSSELLCCTHVSCAKELRGKKYCVGSGSLLSLDLYNSFLKLNIGLKRHFWVLPPYYTVRYVYPEHHHKLQELRRAAWAWNVQGWARNVWIKMSQYQQPFRLNCLYILTYNDKLGRQQSWGINICGG